ASSSRFRISVGIAKSIEAKLSSSCVTFVAPTIVEVIPGCVATQFNATCAGGLLSCFATSSSALSTRQLRSENRLKGLPPGVVSRPCPSPLCPLVSRLYFPLKNPPASGLHGQTASPSSCAAGTCSRSIVRSTSEYSSCSAISGSEAWHCASVCARVKYHAGVSENP